MPIEKEGVILCISPPKYVLEAGHNLGRDQATVTPNRGPIISPLINHLTRCSMHKRVSNEFIRYISSTLDMTA